MKSIFGVSLLLLTTICCCCGGSWSGGFDRARLEELLGGNFEQILKDADVDLTEVLGTPTPTADEAESPAEPVLPDSVESSAEPAQESAVVEPSTAEGSSDQPPATEEGSMAQPPAADEGSADQPPADAESLLEELQKQAGDGSGEPLSFGCEDVTLPMPADVEGCVSMAGFTTYSTSLGKDEINKLYDDYFTGQGWSQFAPMIQDDVINAWSSDAGFAFLTFVPNGGENGKNMVSVGELTE